MKKEKIQNILIIMFITTTFLCIFSINSYAKEPTKTQLENVKISKKGDDLKEIVKTPTKEEAKTTKGGEIINPDDYKPASSDTSTGTYRIKDMANRIIGTIQIIGTILSVATIGILGIKYMIGSVEEKAEYKKTFTAYIIGAIMIFAITNILAIIIKISTNVFEI